MINRSQPIEMSYYSAPMTAVGHSLQIASRRQFLDVLFAPKATTNLRSDQPLPGQEETSPIT